MSDVHTFFVIKDAIHGGYYRGGSPRFPDMGGTRDEAFPFADRMACGEAMRALPLTIIAISEEVARG